MPPPVSGDVRERAKKGNEYVCFGTYSSYEARQLLDAFVKNDIRFEVDVANRPPPASMTGRFGIDAGVSIAIHTDDSEKATQQRADVFKVQV